MFKEYYYFNDLKLSDIQNANFGDSIISQKQNDLLFEVTKCDGIMLNVKKNNNLRELVYISKNIDIGNDIDSIQKALIQNINLYFQTQKSEEDRRFIIIFAISKNKACIKYEKFSFYSKLHALKKFQELTKTFNMLMDYWKFEKNMYTIKNDYNENKMEGIYHTVLNSKNMDDEYFLCIHDTNNHDNDDLDSPNSFQYVQDKLSIIS